MECPRTEVVFAHLRLAERVEEELEVPDNAGHGGEDVVLYEDAGRDALSELHGVDVLQGGTGFLRGAHWVHAGLTAELRGRAAACDKDAGPDEVGGEASPENDDEDGQVLPQRQMAGADELGFRDVADGRARFQAEGEKGTHDAGTHGDQEAAQQ